MALPAITRKTNRGLPRYLDDPDVGRVPAGPAPRTWSRSGPSGRQVARDAPAARRGGRDYLVQGYRPRVEGLFARIERGATWPAATTHWRDDQPRQRHHRLRSDAASRIADPGDRVRVFSWLICETHDDTRQRRHVYEYVAEDSAGWTHGARPRARTAPRGRRVGEPVPQADPLRQHEAVARRTWQLRPLGRRSRTAWLFEVVFDYGDHRERAPDARARPAAGRCAADPFSTYRAGFEMRTYRLCQRVLMFHHFPDEPDVGADCLVSLDRPGLRRRHLRGEPA